MSEIHFSIALEKGTNNLVNATDVKNGKECNCYCASCKEDLVAVNQGIVQRPHFRHNKDSECPFSQSYESYIHWLAKAVINTLDTIQLPPIYISDLNLYKGLHQQVVNKVKNLLKTYGLLQDFDVDRIQFYALLLQPARVIEIQHCSLEKLFQTKKGNIVVDAVISTRNHYLFLEPFYTNPISGVKFEKLTDLGVSTISINLIEFVMLHNFYFSKEVFTEYIKSVIKGKKWIFIRKSKVDQLIDKLFSSNVVRNLSQVKQNISENKGINEQISAITDDLQELDRQYYLSRKKLSDEIKTLQNKLYVIKPSDLFN